MNHIKENISKRFILIAMLMHLQLDNFFCFVLTNGMLVFADIACSYTRVLI